MALTKRELLELRGQILQLKEFQKVEELLPRESAYQFLYRCNSDRLDKYALNYLGRKYTFGELFAKIDTVAKAFQEKGIKPNDTVAMAMLSTPEAIISFYALNKIGALVYMVNATHEKKSIEEELHDAKAKALVVNSIFYDKDMMKFTEENNISFVVAAPLDASFPTGFYGDMVKFKMIEMVKKIGNAVNADPKCFKWNDFLELGKKSTREVIPYYEKNQGIAIASTSGSTGKAKRPLMTNENLNAIPVQMGMTCDVFAPNDSILTTLPIWIFYSLFNSIHEPLCLGVTVDLDPLFDSKKISKRLKQYRFNHWNTIPSYVEDMVNDKNLKNMDLSFLKSITTGGDYRTPKLKAMAEQKLKENNSSVEIGQGYGASECGGCFCYSYEQGMPAETIGKPLIGNVFKIVDVDTGEKLGPNASGELYLYSPTMMKGYYHDDITTAQALVTDENGIRWYRTEDMAHYDDKGQLFMDGRLRRIEISRDGNGMPTKVFPDTIKQIVSLHPSIEACEIIMVPDDARITRPVAYIVLKEGTTFGDDMVSQINDICAQEHIARYTIPTEYIPIPEIPKTPGLKVDLNKLTEMYQETNTKTPKKLVKSHA